MKDSKVLGSQIASAELLMPETWKYVQEYAQKGYKVIKSDSKETIAHVREEKDAALIACTVELLQACKGWVSAYELGMIQPQNKIGCEAAIEATRMLIAKAEGKLGGDTN